MLASPTLPFELIDPCMEMMKAMMPSEREFIRVIVEVIIDLRDHDELTEEPTEIVLHNTSFSNSSHSILRRRRERSVKEPVDREGARKEDREAADLRALRCLMICNSMLERVNGPFDDNSTLQGILNDLIIPSVQRMELFLREKALTALGLCSLIAKRMALGSFELFSSECVRAPDPIRIVVLRVIFDLMLTYERAFFGKSAEMDSKLITFLLSIMDIELGKDEPCPEVLALLCIGFSKLLLLGIVDNDKMLLCLLIAYISPDMASNQEAKQCLSYFFIRYSTAHPQNKIRLQSIFMTALDTMTRLSESLDELQNMTTPERFGEMLLAWSNPQFGLENEDFASIKDLHAKIAIDILITLYDSERSDHGILCHLLNQPLFLPEDLDLKMIHMIDLLLINHSIQCPFDDAATTKAFDRFRTRFNKIYSKQLTDINPLSYVHDDKVLQIYQAINIDVPESDGEMSSPLWKDVSKKNKVSSQAPDNDGIESEMEQDEDGDTTDEEAEEAASWAATTGPIDEDIHTGAESVILSAISTPISMTPKAKGRKRIRTPDSGGYFQRKRNHTTSSRDLVESESESEDGNETPTPIKTNLRLGMKLGTAAQQMQQQPSNIKQKQLKVMPEKQTSHGVKLRRAPSSKTQTRGRRKLPTPLRPEEESGAESTLRTFPQLEEHSDDDLGTYSDEI